MERNLCGGCQTRGPHGRQCRLNGKTKCRACTRRAFDADGAAHHRRQVLTNRQAQTRAAVAPSGAGVGLKKRLKQLLLLFRRDADAGVAHRKLDHCTIPAAVTPGYVDEDITGGGELDGVADQIDEDLAQPRGVGDQASGHVIVDLVEQVEVFLLRRGADDGENLFDAARWLEGMRFQFQVARLDFRKI